MSSIIYRTNPASGYVYAYKSTSFWDPKLKRPRSHQEYLGRVDPETKEILPKGTNGKRNRGPSRKSDPQKDAELDSIKKEIVYDRLAPCQDCDGTGLGEGGKEVSCPECGGSGRVVSVQRTFLGDMRTTSTCGSCGGTGRSIDNPCPECEGQGRVPDRQRVTVEVPAGIRDSQQLRVTGFGEAGLRGAAAGNLIVTCRIQPHDFFEREGDNLHARANISMVQAALGAEIEVDGIMPDEKVGVRIPEGCQNDQVIRVRGKGMPKFRSDLRGDLFVHASVVIPKKLTKSQRELLEKLASDMGEDFANARSPLEKLRDAFN